MQEGYSFPAWSISAMVVPCPLLVEQFWGVSPSRFCVGPVGPELGGYMRNAAAAHVLPKCFYCDGRLSLGSIHTHHGKAYCEFNASVA